MSKKTKGNNRLTAAGQPSVRERIAELMLAHGTQRDAVLTARREVERLNGLIKQAHEQMIGRAARIDELKRLENADG